LSEPEFTEFWEFSELFKPSITEVRMNRVKFVALAVSVSLAMIFTFSCSDDGEGNSTGVENNPVKKDKISGISQKGPFIKGSTATLYELNDKFAQTGRSFRDFITDDKGSFEIKNVELVSPYAMLEVDGFYRNEITGKISTAQIKLYAIADIREKDNINVNLLTHLEYFRVQKLVEGGKSLTEAKKQAQREILAVFNISGEFENSEDMSIFGTSESDAALLAISILMQGSLSEGEFSERLTDFSLGFRESGFWNNEATKTAMADWAVSSNESSIRNNILGWELSSSVPDFEKYVRNYWHTNYGLGVCNVNLQGNIKSSPKEMNYICKDNDWVLATEYELDIYQWICKEGEIKSGQASGKKYICKNKKWQRASYIDVKCFESNSCLTFEDTRDNQSYVYVVIGEQTWMAENLNYNAGGSECYANDAANCEIYGRLYDMATAMTACPSDWHLPSNREWDQLFNYTDDDYNYTSSGPSTYYTSSGPSIYLRATSGWDNNKNGEDEYGFAALPSGYGYYNPEDFFGAGDFGNWWSNDLTMCWDWKGGKVVDVRFSTHLFSVRCIRD
jgi:uncharacterized protein (TIGR02145 family)